MLQTATLAVSVAADAFAVSVAKGASFPRLSLARSAGIALAFGAVETATPFLGFLLSRDLAQAIAHVDHWAAFAILALLGARMLWKSRRGGESAPAALAPPTIVAVFATAFCTSVDGAAVGASLAFVAEEIVPTLVAIGLVTFALTFGGLRLGGVAGARVGRWAETVGAFGLIAVGAWILATHLSA